MEHVDCPRCRERNRQPAQGITGLSYCVLCAGASTVPACLAAAYRLLPDGPFGDPTVTETNRLRERFADG